jgi:AcrR family transcriptional regulator
MRQAIVDAAQKLFQQFGLAKTTMEDIAKVVGKGKSSLYYYYATKEEIFEAVVEKEKNNIQAEIDAAINKEEAAEDKLRLLALTKHKALRKRRLLYKLGHVELPDNVCMFNIIKKRYHEAEANILKMILALGMATGEFRQVDEEELDMLVAVFSNSLKGMQLELSWGDYRGSAPNLINKTLDVLIRGIK